MQNNSSTRKLVETAKFTAIAVMIVISSIYIPFFLVIGLFIWTIPVTLIHVRNGFKYSLMSIIIIYIFTTLAQGPVLAFVFLGLCGLLGPVLGQCIKTKEESSTTFLMMVGTVLLSTVIIFKGSAAVLGKDILLQSIDMVIKSYSMVKSTYISAGVPKDVMQNIMKNMPTAELMKTYIPSGLLIFSAFVSLLNYIITEKVLKKLGVEVKGLRSFSEWYMPRKVAIPFILILIVTYIFSSPTLQNGQTYLLNMLRIFQVMFTVIGLSAVDYYMNKKQLPKGVRIVALILSGTTIILNIIFYIGIFDYIFNFRKLDVEKNI